LWDRSPIPPFAIVPPSSTVRRLYGNLARLLVNELATGKLFPDHVGFFNVIEARRPSATAQA
jgi:hypothetical protein